MKQLLGGLLLAAGILIAGASGLCSTVYIVVGSLSLFSANSLAEAIVGAFYGLMLLLFVGGIPFGIGMGLVVAGRRLLRENSPMARRDFL